MDEQATVSNEAATAVRKPHVTGWTAAKRHVFLDHLARTCNIRIASEAVGMTTNSAHMLRRRDPVFAEGCTEALARGYDQIEARLLERALGQSDAQDGDAGRAFDPDLALRILQMRNASSRPGRQDARSRVTRVSVEQVEASLRKKLDALAKRLKEDI